MAFWAYMLRCADGTYYTGHTEDLERRVAEHHAATCGGYTASRLPVVLVWCSDFAERHEALTTELKVKNWSRAKKEGLIAGNWNKVSHFAKPPSRRMPRHDVSTSSTSARHERTFENNPVPQTSSVRVERTFENSPVPQTISVRVERASSEVEKPSRDTLRERKPVIVLVRPQLGENIGKAARAMLNFGLTELRLVEPRDGWPNPAAGPAAAGADSVLEHARVFGTTAEAVADCAHVYATTVRKRGVTKPVLTPEDAARDIASAPGKSAILFGAERSGLETEDVDLARAILTVPINPGFSSLNLAQAVILCAYEWSKTQGAALVQPPQEDLLPPAPQEELEGLIDHFEKLLESRDYFVPPARAEATRRTLRGVLTKPGWNHLEVRTLRGVLSALERTPR